MPVAAPSIRGRAAPQQGASKPPQRAPQAIPFRRASRKKTQLAFQTGPTNLTAQVQGLTPIEVPPAGFLRFIDLIVSVNVAGNVTNNVVFNADAPFNVISQLSVTTAAGDPLLVPVSGHQLAMINKYAASGVDAPYCDPRSRFSFNPGITGTGGTAGTATFTLRIPAEIDPITGFCAVPNLAANRAYQINLSLNTLAAIYGTAPSTVPTVSITAIMYFWSQPYSANPANVPQTQSPIGEGSVSVWRLDTPSVSGGGDKLVKLNNVGNVIRMVIFDLTTPAGARDDTDWPAISQLLLNNDVLFYMPKNEWQDQIAESYGYTSSRTLDAQGGLDTGIFPVPWLMNMAGGRIRNSGPRDQFLVTLDATLLQMRGTSFGAGAGTLNILTNEIKPTNSAALYAHL